MDCPLLSKDVKEYVDVNDLENGLNQIMNDILIKMPNDPYSAIITHVKNFCSEGFYIDNVEFKSFINSEFKHYPAVVFELIYKGQRKVINYPLMLPNNSFVGNIIIGEDICDKLMVILKEALPILSSTSSCYYENIIAFEGNLFLSINSMEKTSIINNKTDEIIKTKVAKSLLTTLSFALHHGLYLIKYEGFKYLSYLDFYLDLKDKYGNMSRNKSKSKSSKKTITINLSESNVLNTSSKEEPKKSNTNVLNLNDILLNNDKITSLGIMIFKCGKDVSKVKYDKFFIIMDLSKHPKKQDIINVIKILQNSSKKILTAGKLGENGFRLNIEGSHFSPSDTINDTVKLVEEIIKEAQKDPIYSNSNIKLTIGIDCNSNSYYSEGTKKYDMDGMKKPPDSDELIEYYLKYIQDHSLISYFEDPLADSDITGWKKMIKKFSEKLPNVILSCKNIVSNNSSLKQHLIPSKMEEALKMINQARYEADEKGIQMSITNDPEKLMEEINNIKILPSCVGLSILNYESIGSFIDSYKTAALTKHAKTVIWENSVGFGKSSIVDLAFTLKADMIVLSGLNSKSGKIENFQNVLDYFK